MTEAPLHATPSTDPASGQGGRGRGGWTADVSAPAQRGVLTPMDTSQEKCPTSSSPTFVHTFHLGPRLAQSRWYPRLARRNPTSRQNDRPITTLLVLACATERVPPPLPSLKLFLLPSLMVSSKRHRQRVRVCFNNETATLLLATFSSTMKRKGYPFYFWFYFPGITMKVTPTQRMLLKVTPTPRILMKVTPTSGTLMKVIQTPSKLRKELH